MSNPPQPCRLHRFAHDAMAATFEICIEAETSRYAESAAGAAFAEIDRLERALSRFIENSDISRINALAAGASVKVGVEAFECLELSQAVWQETGGAFDVTVGGILSNASRPSGVEAGAALDRVPVGTPLLHLDAARKRVGVTRAGVVVDLGAIGKGYAVDRCVEVLDEWGIARGLVHSGQSSVYALGTAPVSAATAEQAGGWRMPLRDPRDHELVLGHVVLCNSSLSGSGRRLHGEHILDPRTRRPCGHETIGAWAVAGSAALSDAFSTAFMVMTPEQVEACCLRHPEISAILAIQSDGCFDVLRFGAAETQ